MFGCSGGKNTQDNDETTNTELDSENSDIDDWGDDIDEIGSDDNSEESIIYDPSLIETLPKEVKEECVGITSGVATNIDGDLDKTFTIETKTETQDVIYDVNRTQLQRERELYTWKIGVESIVINSNPYEGLEERAEEIFTDVYKYKEDTHELAKYVSPNQKASKLSESDAAWLGYGRGMGSSEDSYKNCMILGNDRRGLVLVGINRKVHYQGLTPNHTAKFMNYATFERVDGVWYVVYVR